MPENLKQTRLDKFFSHDIFMFYFNIRFRPKLLLPFSFIVSNFCRLQLIKTTYGIFYAHTILINLAIKDMKDDKNFTLSCRVKNSMGEWSQVNPQGSIIRWSVRMPCAHLTLYFDSTGSLKGTLNIVISRRLLTRARDFLIDHLVQKPCLFFYRWLTRI